MLETAGGHLPLPLGRRARNAISPNVYTLYGATEAGRLAFTKLQLAGRSAEAVGFVSPWCQVEIVDESDRPVKLGGEGVVRVKTVGIIDSYFKSRELTAKNLRNGWFYPGDVGSLDADGLLRITSRIDDVVNLGGVKFSLIGAEETLRLVPGVTDVAAFGVTMTAIPEVWAAVVNDNTLDQGALKIKMGEAKISRVIHLQQLPRNENGKILKQKLIEAASALLENSEPSI